MLVIFGWEWSSGNAAGCSACSFEFPAFLTIYPCQLIFLFMENVFDPLKFFEDLKAADVPEKQARVQAEAMRAAFAAYDASRMKELATKGDIQEIRLEIKALELRLLKWQFGIALALAAIMAKGFGWLGF